MTKKNEINENSKNNIIAIVGLAISLFANGLAGITLSIVGISESNNTGYGKSIAIWGIIIGIIRIILEVLLIIFIWNKAIIPLISLIN